MPDTWYSNKGKKRLILPDTRLYSKQSEYVWYSLNDTVRYVRILLWIRQVGLQRSHFLLTLYRKAKRVFSNDFFSFHYFLGTCEIIFLTCSLTLPLPLNTLTSLFTVILPPGYRAYSYSLNNCFWDSNFFMYWIIFISPFLSLLCYFNSRHIFQDILCLWYDFTEWFDFDCCM